MRNAMPALLLLTLTACASQRRQMTPEEIATETARRERVNAVRVTKNSEATKGCRFLANVVPAPVDYKSRDQYRAVFGSEIRDREAQKQADAQADAKSAIHGMKFKTEELGGNVLFVVSDFPAANGEAYACHVPDPAPAP